MTAHEILEPLVQTAAICVAILIFGVGVPVFLDWWTWRGGRR